MDPSGLDFYKEVFLNSAEESVFKMNQSLNTKNVDCILLHRLFHNLKGQVLFMNLNDLGLLCLKGEKKLDEIVKNNLVLEDDTKQELMTLVNKISLDLKQYENINR